MGFERIDLVKASEPFIVGATSGNPQRYVTLDTEVEDGVSVVEVYRLVNAAKSGRESSYNTRLEGPRPKIARDGKTLAVKLADDNPMVTRIIDAQRGYAFPVDFCVEDSARYSLLDADADLLMDEQDFWESANMDVDTANRWEKMVVDYNKE